MKRWCLTVGSLAWLAGCATGPPLALDAVGPAPPRVGRVEPRGHLKVYSATDWHIDGGVDYYPHKPYRIRSRDGKSYKMLANASSICDETPECVTLPAGAYVVEADADRFGRVKVPVVIRPGRLTVVNLERDGSESASAIGAGDWVMLPDGHPVGWRARGIASAGSP